MDRRRRKWNALRPRIHPGYFGVEGGSKEGARKCKVVVGAEFKKFLTILVDFTQAMMRSERAIPLIASRSSPSGKISSKNHIIAFGNGRE